MEFIEKTRKLTSSTGFLKHKESGAIYNYSIYLGIYSSVDEYEEVSEQDYIDYLELLRKQEEEARRGPEDSSDDETVIENIE